jgi:hypothetical protein
VETDVTGRITKIGDGEVRPAVYKAANVMLTRPVKGGALKNLKSAARYAGRQEKGERRLGAQAFGGLAPGMGPDRLPDNLGREVLNS